MSLAELLLARQEPRGPQCRMGLYLAALPAADRAELEDVLARREINGTTIAAYLNEKGASQIKGENVNRHRKAGKPGGCQCPSPTI